MSVTTAIDSVPTRPNTPIYELGDHPDCPLVIGSSLPNIEDAGPTTNIVQPTPQAAPTNSRAGGGRPRIQFNPARAYPQASNDDSSTSIPSTAGDSLKRTPKTYYIDVPYFHIPDSAIVVNPRLVASREVSTAATLRCPDSVVIPFKTQRLAVQEFNRINLFNHFVRIVDEVETDTEDDAEFTDGSDEQEGSDEE